MSEPKKELNIISRYLLMALGFIALILAVIGAFLPIIPTTPFVILALWLFSKSSDRFYRALIAHKICGPPVKDYLAGRGIKKQYKVISVIFMWISLTASLIISWSLPDTLWVKIVVPIIGCYVTWFILSRPTCPED